MKIEFKDECKFVTSKIRWDFRISCVLATVKEIEIVNDELEKEKEKEKSRGEDEMRSISDQIGLLAPLCKVRMSIR